MIPHTMEFHNCLAQAMTQACASEIDDSQLDPLTSLEKFNLCFVSFSFRVLFLSHFIESFPGLASSLLCARAPA